MFFFLKDTVKKLGKNSALIASRNELKLLCGGRSLAAQDCILMVFINFELFWIFTKSSVENKTNVNML